MKIKFWHNNNANIDSRVSEVLDLQKDLGVTSDEWTAMDEDARLEIVKEWALQSFDYGFEEIVK